MAAIYPSIPVLHYTFLLLLTLQSFLYSAHATIPKTKRAAATGTAAGTGNGAPAPTDISCFINTNGKNWEGKDVASPASWCVCNQKTKTGIYSTIPDKTGLEMCSYTSMPSQTISISNLPKASNVVITSCKLTTFTGPPATSTASGVDKPYCTCNDDNMWGPPVEQTVTGSDKKTTTVCSPPPPTGTPLCGAFGKQFGDEKPPKVFNRDQGQDAIKKFCGLQGDSPKYHLDAKATSDPSSREIFYYDTKNEYCWSEQPTGTDLVLGQWSIGPDCNSPLATYITLQFQRVTGNATNCPAGDAWDLPKGQKECFDKLNPIVDGCDTGSTDKKNGGALRVRTDKGCFDLGMWGTSPNGKGDAKSFPEGKPDVFNQIGM